MSEMIDWQLELDSAENNNHHDECGHKLIDMARQILRERDELKEEIIRHRDVIEGYEMALHKIANALPPNALSMVAGKALSAASDYLKGNSK